MFTGIITDVGRLRSIDMAGGDPKLIVETSYDTTGMAIGASVIHSGICLTVITKGANWFEVQLSAETLGITTAKHWQPGTTLNLERALKIGDELGGHIVSGHVDGIGRVLEAHDDHESLRLVVEAPIALARLIARKGSIAIDGVSLTVNEVNGRNFGVNIIPHTQHATTLGTLKPGAEVNLEVDMLARYVARFLGDDAGELS